MSIETKMHIETDRLFDKLNELDPTSKEYEELLNKLTKLMNMEIEVSKVDNEREDKLETRKSDEEFKKQQLKIDKKDRLIKNIMSALGIVVPAGLTWVGFIAALRFEESNSVTTAIGKGFLRNLIPRFK